MKTQSNPPDAPIRLEYLNDAITLTRAQWASNCRAGLVHRIGGRRFVIGVDNQRGVRTIIPVNLIEERPAAR